MFRDHHSGYVGPPALWMSFAQEWTHALSEVKIPVFHMVKCEGGKEEGFETLDEQARLLLCQRLVGIIRRHEPRAFYVSLRNDDFRQVVLANIPKDVRMESRAVGANDPYIRLAHNCLFAVLSMQEEGLLSQDPCDLVFDWHQQFNRMISSAIDAHMRDYLTLEGASVAARFGSATWPRPAERVKYIPLQAADFLVWHLRRALDMPDGTSRRIYQSLMAASEPRHYPWTATEMMTSNAALALGDLLGDEIRAGKLPVIPQQSFMHHPSAGYVLHPGVSALLARKRFLGDV